MGTDPIYLNRTGFSDEKNGVCPHLFALIQRYEVAGGFELILVVDLHALPVPVRVLQEQIARDAARQAPRADLEAGDVARERAVAHGRAPVEDMHAAELGMLALQLKRIARIGKPRLLGKFLNLRSRHVRAPRIDGIADRRELRTLGEADVEAGADDNGVEAVLAFRRQHFRPEQDVVPSLAEADREAWMALAAQHALVRRRA